MEIQSFGYTPIWNNSLITGGRRNHEKLKLKILTPISAVFIQKEREKI